MSPRFQMLIVGGCMIQQNVEKNNIEFSELYHQKLKKILFEQHNIELDYELIRYERFSVCLDRINKVLKTRKIDLILFQVRGNFYLQTIKFFVMIRHRSLKTVLPGFNILRIRPSIFENHSPFIIKSISKKKWWLDFHKTRFYSRIHRLNYKLGLLFGNETVACNSYLQLILNVTERAISNRAGIIFLGVTSRPDNRIEDWLSKRLNQKIRKYMNEKKLDYIDVFGTTDQDGNYKFSEKMKISLNEYGHLDITRKLLPYILKSTVK